MKNLLLIAVVLFLAACGERHEIKPVTSIKTANGYEVEKLFEHDGCAMYRFEDAQYYRYFAKCGKQTSITEEHDQYCGKGCHKRIQVTTVQDADK